MVKTQIVAAPVAYRMDEAARVACHSRALLYNEAAAGRLVLTRHGRRTVVLHEDLMAWLRAGRQAKAA